MNGMNYQSVYRLEEMSETEFKESVKIKINGKSYTLATALNLNPTNKAFSGFDLESIGSKPLQ